MVTQIEIIIATKSFAGDRALFNKKKKVKKKNPELRYHGA